jgi:hypothetical protein
VVSRHLLACRGRRYGAGVNVRASLDAFALAAVYPSPNADHEERGLLVKVLDAECTS